MFLRRAATLLALALVVVLSPAAPAAWARPAQPGTISFVAASKTALVLDWPAVTRAGAYEVFMSTREQTPYTKKVKRVSGSGATIRGLAPGRTYCFQVRALAGSSVGFKGGHACKPTIRSMSAVGGTRYAVMTFNTCSDACSGWSSRAAYARKVVATRKPDVLAAQESGAWATPPSGMAGTTFKSAKRLFYKSSRFTLASNSSGARTGDITLSPGKYAVWAELVDRATSKRIIFVSAHLTQPLNQYALRGREVDNLLARMKQINTSGLEVVYAGDFNSNKNRGTWSASTGFGSQDSVGRRFAAAGYYDGYDLARTLNRPNWNSFSSFSATPTTSKVWGDHVDHVYIRPAKTNVWRWINASLYSGSRYTTPKPSDHNPVQVDLYIP
jgi:endonuclease/exonuclease/phosphatase family metal-dependent hydrolase